MGRRRAAAKVVECTPFECAPLHGHTSLVPLTLPVGCASRDMPGSLLPAWRNLEELELRFAYDHRLPEFHLRSMHNNHTPFQDFSADLAATLRTGCLPRLRFLFVGNLSRTHCLGQRLSRRNADGATHSPYGTPYGSTGTNTSVELDDRSILEALKPTVCAAAHPPLIRRSSASCRHSL